LTVECKGNIGIKINNKRLEFVLIGLRGYPEA